MKKLGKKIIALAAVAVMGLSMIACGKKSVADYVKSDEIQQAVKTFEDTMGSDVGVDITAEGDKMVYTFKYKTIEKQDGMEEQFEAAMSAQESTFQTAANQLKEQVKADKPSVVVKYVDKNDDEIYSKEYVAE